MIGFSWLVVAVALGILVGLGHAVLALVVRTTRLYWFERWSLAFLLGTCAASLAWCVLSPLYGLIAPIWVVSAFAGVAMLAGARVARAASGASGEGGARGQTGALEIALCALLALECAAVLLTALHAPLGWDGLFNFEIKARLAFENIPTGRLPVGYFSDTSRTWTHPRYPLLVPFAELWIYEWLGRVDQAAIKVVFPLFYFSLIGILCGAVRRMTNLRVALLACVAVGALPPMTVQAGATSGYADLPLAASMLGAVSFTLLALSTANPEALGLAAMLSTSAVWTKAEGLLLVCALAAAASIAKLPIRKTAVLLGMPLLIALPWLVIQGRYGMPDGDFLPVSAAVLVGNLHRLPASAVQIGRELLLPGHWGMIWVAAGALIAMMIARGRSTASDRLLAAAFVIPLILYAAVFIFSTWPDVREHVRWSIPRLLVPLTPMALMFAIRRLWVDLGVEISSWR